MSDFFTETIPENFIGQRIDTAVSVRNFLTRNYAQKLLEQGNITVNGKAVQKNYILKKDDVIKINIPPPMILKVVPENIPLNIVYEDEHLLVVNKNKGMTVHPAHGNYTATLVNALMAHCGNSLSEINGVIRPGIVHRIDKDTSGLLVVAKNNFAHIHLAEQIKKHTFTREYQAIVHGSVKSDSDIINLPIGRDILNRKRMSVTNKFSRSAVTHYTVIERFDEFTHLSLRLETGRTHQIRVHMKYINHPLVGDILYAPNKNKHFAFLNGQCLHAKKIGFVHPYSNSYMEFDSNLPEYFECFLEKIKYRTVK
jgi:23S rRNA pseudouridine1911/1915/1917 synthase